MTLPLELKLKILDLLDPLVRLDNDTAYRLSYRGLKSSCREWYQIVANKLAERLVIYTCDDSRHGFHRLRQVTADPWTSAHTRELVVRDCRSHSGEDFIGNITQLKSELDKLTGLRTIR